MLGLALLLEPREAEAQSRERGARSGTTSGSTRAVRSRREGRGEGGGGGGGGSGGGEQGESGRYEPGTRSRRVSTAPPWSRRRRVRIRVRPGMLVDARCRFYDDYCVYDEWDYTGDSMMGLGFSIGLGGALFDTSNNRLGGARVNASGLDLGLSPQAGVDVRLFLVYARLRVGLAAQAGVATTLGGRLEGDFEEGSTQRAGFGGGAWGIFAYAPQVSDYVQLWVGGRLGWSTTILPVYASGRHYDRVARDFVSVGPELGVRFDAGGTVGLMLWGFADLAQLGHGQVSLAFVFELPRPPGPAL